MTGSDIWPFEVEIPVRSDIFCSIELEQKYMEANSSDSNAVNVLQFLYKILIRAIKEVFYR